MWRETASSGIYPSGSLAFGDYVDHDSDMDLVSVVDGELSLRERAHLVAALTPDPAVGLPGAGLDLLVVGLDEAQQPTQRPHSQLAVGLFAGRRWQPDFACDEHDDPLPHLVAAAAVNRLLDATLQHLSESS